MNKKIIIAFGISIFLGIGYLAYRKSPLGRKLKGRSIIKRILKNQEERNIKWKFPNEVLEGCEENLKKLNYEQLELIEDYVVDKLNRKDTKVLDAHRERLLKAGVDWTTDLPHLEDMLFNTGFLSDSYSKSKINK